MANIAGTYDQNAEPSSGDYETVPTGEYLAVIEQAEKDVPISERMEKGKCLELTWKITGEHYNGRLIWQRLNMWADNMNNLDKVIAIANSQFAAIRHAIGNLNVTDTDQLLEIPCIIKVVHVPEKTDPVTGQTYKAKNEVKAVKPANAGPAARSAPPASRGPTPTTRGPAPGKAPAAGGGKANPFGHLKSGAQQPAMADDEIPF